MVVARNGCCEWQIQVQRLQFRAKNSLFLPKTALEAVQNGQMKGNGGLQFRAKNSLFLPKTALEAVQNGQMKGNGGYTPQQLDFPVLKSPLGQPQSLGNTTRAKPSSRPFFFASHNSGSDLEQQAHQRFVHGAPAITPDPIHRVTTLVHVLLWPGSDLLLIYELLVASNAGDEILPEKREMQGQGLTRKGPILRRPWRAIWIIIVEQAELYRV
eukprot:CAMPEP_0174381304 /NCGR_PEP_ID=MMETSP0811_2-20130205/123923_1 /TAXON_ID=73025 ORGANISM="Eutreptiella gymnastica-like, Strain CCMP1594" /NCGR_SAMPLE_ID=MMETSP0811_2 /ASSEMBLY_ACC=CAM_ASM_000667 /LENGTH=212 /DNA_ID=CAMNT_0015534401 /DNA_START=424 /DNA_END=1062 /DNA_ORIENTATION=+